MPAVASRPSSDLEVDGVLVREDGPTFATSLVESRPVLDVVEILGEQSKEFVGLQTLLATSASQLPPQVVPKLAAMYCSTETAPNRYDGMAHYIKDFLRGVTVHKNDAARNSVGALRRAAPSSRRRLLRELDEVLLVCS
jgi:hypothetical protein